MVVGQKYQTPQVCRSGIDRPTMILTGFPMWVIVFQLKFLFIAKLGRQRPICLQTKPFQQKSGHVDVGVLAVVRSWDDWVGLVLVNWDCSRSPASHSVGHARVVQCAACVCVFTNIDTCVEVTYVAAGWCGLVVEFC